MAKSIRKKGLFFSAMILGLGAFGISMAVNTSFETLAKDLPLSYSAPMLLFVVAAGVAGDVIGIAATRAKEPWLLSMASAKVSGAKEALWFTRNASRVSSVFNDLMGDVAATLSGALVVSMTYKMRIYFSPSYWLILTGIGVGLTSFLGVSAKAFLKPVTLRYAENIILLLGKVRYYGLKGLRGD